ncbi:hypothetical protein M0813_02099 [Anaeramoeba flamelloides]|uniref:Uncharacterized protein n=1 Tax=Anaeramoeba flamelloides TaxID=1746091 RepID=A0ABQ8YQH2_9EUKA|nr:hypothetical protein M0813_02099 [Anaeramoeba flamelloides]
MSIFFDRWRKIDLDQVPKKDFKLLAIQFKEFEKAWDDCLKHVRIGFSDFQILTDQPENPEFRKSTIKIREIVRNINHNNGDDSNHGDFDCFGSDDSFGSDDGNKNNNKNINYVIMVAESTKDRDLIISAILYFIEQKRSLILKNTSYCEESGEIYKYSGNNGSDHERNEENMEYDHCGYNSDTSRDIGGEGSNGYEGGD